MGGDDRVELFNRGAVPVDLTGWQVVSETNDGSSLTTWTLPQFSLDGGHYVLLHEDSAANTLTDLYFDDNVSWVHEGIGSCACWRQTAAVWILYAGALQPRRLRQALSGLVRILNLPPLPTAWAGMTSARIRMMALILQSSI